MKIRIVTMMLAGAAFAASAAPLTPGQALARLGSGESHRARALVQPELALSTRAAYVFNSAAGGYMVVGADDLAAPLLGYSDTGAFDADNMPEALKWWLGEYDRQIEYAASRGLTPSAAPMRVAKEAIAPMIEARWDQGAPFNNLCPLYGADRVYTGCVATAMSQVMHYWRYPECGQGSISYTSPTIEKKLSLNFALRPFEWDNMKNTYYDGYTDEQADAVAYLMKAAGYSVKMDYSTSASGALAMDIGNALNKYFNYDGNYDYRLRDLYSTEQWNEMVYDNLKNVGPLIYGGASYIGGGHSFVCDGYDSNGFFHFNWGWSGMGNGYFSLDALSPGALGAGGGAGGGYSSSQDAVFGIQPPTGQPVLPKSTPMVQRGNLTATLGDDNVVSFELSDAADAMWVNYNPKTLRLSFGVIIESQTGSEAEKLYVPVTTRRFEFKAGYGTGPAAVIPRLNLPELALADGTYKLTMATFPVSDTSNDAAPEEWTPVNATYGSFNYVTVQKTGNSYSVKNGEIPQLKVSGELVGPLYWNMSSTWRVTVENPSDIEVCSGFAPCLADEKLGAVLLGESVRLTIPAHGSATHEWSTMLYKMQQYSISGPTQLGFTFFNEINYTFYSEEFLEEVTMMPAPSAAKLAFSGAPKVKGSTTKMIAGMPTQMIPDPTMMTLSTDVTLQSGYFCYPLVACLCSIGENGYMDILTTAGKVMTLSEEGQTETYTVDMSYPLMQPNTTYYIVMANEVTDGYVPLETAPTGVIRWDGNSALDEIDAPTLTVPVEIYNLAGLRLGSDINSLPPGIYILRQGSATRRILRP